MIQNSSLQASTKTKLNHMLTQSLLADNLLSRFFKWLCSSREIYIINFTISFSKAAVWTRIRNRISQTCKVYTNYWNAVTWSMCEPLDFEASSVRAQQVLVHTPCSSSRLCTPQSHECTLSAAVSTTANSSRRRCPPEPAGRTVPQVPTHPSFIAASELWKLCAPYESTVVRLEMRCQ